MAAHILELSSPLMACFRCSNQVRATGTGGENHAHEVSTFGSFAEAKAGFETKSRPGESRIMGVGGMDPNKIPQLNSAVNTWNTHSFEYHGIKGSNCNSFTHAVQRFLSPNAFVNTSRNSLGWNHPSSETAF